MLSQTSLWCYIYTERVLLIMQAYHFLHNDHGGIIQWKAVASYNTNMQLAISNILPWNISR